MSLLLNLCLALFVLVALLMVLVILMQRPKSEGLGAAFGGAVTENIFGAQTTNVLVKFTSWLAGIFFALTFALSILYAHQSTADSAFRRALMIASRAADFSRADHCSTFTGLLSHCSSSDLTILGCADRRFANCGAGRNGNESHGNAEVKAQTLTIRRRIGSICPRRNFTRRLRQRRGSVPGRPMIVPNTLKLLVYGQAESAKP